MSCSGWFKTLSVYIQSSHHSLTFIFFSKLLFCSSLHLVLKLQQKVNTNEKIVLYKGNIQSVNGEENQQIIL